MIDHDLSRAHRPVVVLVASDLKRLRDPFKFLDDMGGEWFQLTCPARDFSSVPLGQLVMAHASTYHYSGEVAGTLDFVWDALTGFRHIKTETERSRGE